MKSISVIIPTYNGKHLLSLYLPYIYKALSHGSIVETFEIIVIDDASTDDTIAFLIKEYPEIILLENKENMGFSKTINRGIFHAQHDLVLVLNNDMQLSESYFKIMISHFESNETLFGAFSAITDQQGNKIIEAQKKPLLKRSAIHYTDNLNQNKTSKTLYLCGGNALIDRKKLLSLNGFDTIYSPFYFEDFDLSLRAWKRGWECLYIPDTFCMHCHSATINNNFDASLIGRIFVRNRFIFNHIHLEGWSYRIYKAKHKLKFLLSIPLSFIFSKQKEYNLVYASFIEKLPEVNKRRETEKRCSVVDLNGILKYWNE